MTNNLDLRDIIHDGVSANRAADNLRVTNSSRGGFTEYHKRKVVRVSAPLESGAYARTIRIHELLHANHTPAPRKSKYPEIAENAIEDARIHSAFWPNSMPARANRDCLAAALIDLRRIPPMIALGRADDWNRNLLVSLRCAAIINRFGAGSHYGKRDKRSDWQARTRAAFGPIVADELARILTLVKSRKGKALAAFTALMRDEDERDGNGNGSRTGDKSDGAQTDSPMRIVRLPLVEACNSAIRRTSLARSGARLNRARLTSAVINCSTNGLFIRQRYMQGGTYLFDASGSMQLSDERLQALCRTVPAAQVAYYSGWGTPQPDGAYGALVIYADNGRRATDIKHSYGNNDVDLYALQWLLRQPAPRVYIGDGEFCGGPEGQDIRAAALIAGAVANGKIIWHKSISELETTLGR